MTALKERLEKLARRQEVLEGNWEQYLSSKLELEQQSLDDVLASRQKELHAAQQSFDEKKRAFEKVLEQYHGLPVDSFQQPLEYTRPVVQRIKGGHFSHGIDQH